MSKTTKKSSATKATKSATPTKAVKADKPSGKTKATAKPDKALSALDAAAQVLKGSAKPMRTREMITAMAEQRLWSSPNGKTPHATLYSAILREMNEKGREARFRKVGRGQFEFVG